MAKTVESKKAETTEDKFKVKKRDDYAEVDPTLPYEKLNHDIAEAMRPLTLGWKIALAISVTILIAGAVTFYMQTRIGLGLWGTGESVHWGLDLPTFVFFIGLSHSGTLISAILLFTGSNWRRAIYRCAEAMTFFSLLAVQVILLMHVGKPWRFFYMLPYPNYRTLWTNFRSALSWDMIAITSYFIASGIFLLLGSIPDFAAIRDRYTGARRKFYNIMSFGWKGTDREWKNLHRAYIGVAALLFPLMVSVHSIVAWDFAVTNVPGYHSSIFAPFFVLGAVYSGVAGVVMVMIVLRRMLKMHDYIKPYHIDNLAKMLLAVALIWIWITAMEALGPWYKTSVNNFEYLTLLAKLGGTFANAYWFMILCCGVIPLLMFNFKIRNNMVAMFLIATVIQLGMWTERFIIVVGGQAVGYIPAQWSSFFPTFIEAFLFWGFTSAIFFTPFLLFVKFVPPVSIFEVKEILNIPRRHPKKTHHDDEEPVEEKITKKTDIELPQEAGS